MGSVQVVRGRETHAGPPTEGLDRFLAEVDEHVTVGGARSAPQSMSGWHHHGDHTTCVYVVKGQVRIEWGPGGAESAELSGGDFYVVAPNTVHREGNPGSEEDEYLGFWVGTGPIAVNVDGPERGD
jgi:uncharacterized RmlC-like cupin family protein